MTTWIAQPDPTNKGQWRIINSATLKTIVFGLSERDAKFYAERRNKENKKQPHA